MGRVGGGREDGEGQAERMGRGRARENGERQDREDWEKVRTERPVE